jgi:hypothetical protein
MNDKNYNKGFLKEKLGDYRVDPPESVWMNISSRLGRGNRRTIIILSLSAAAAVALAVTLGINYFSPGMPGHRTSSEVPAEGTMVPDHPDVSSDGQGTNDREISEAAEAQTGTDETVETGTGETAETGRESGIREDAESGNGRRPRANRLEEKVVAAMNEQGSRLSQEPQEIGEPADARGRENPQTGLAQAAVPGNLPRDSISQLVEPDHADDTVLDMGNEPAMETVPLPEEKRAKDARWTLGAVLSPLYSFRDAESGAFDNGTDFESGIMAYAGGIQVSYRTAGRLSIESGLLYNKMGISIGAPGIKVFNSSSDYALSGNTIERSSWTAVTNSVGNIVTRSGEIYVNNYKINAVSAPEPFDENVPVEAYTADEGIQQHLDYLELPFNLRYTLVDRTIELQLIGGLSTNFLLNNYVTMDSPSGTEEIGYLTNIRSVNYSGNAGLGMVYHIHRKFSLRLEPRFRYFLHSVNDATLPSTRPYSVGVYTGLNYTF